MAGLEMVGEGRAEEARGQDPRLPRPRDFAELAAAGFVGFSVAPLRVYAGVGDELIDRFAADPAPGRPEPFFSGRLALTRAFVRQCGQDGCNLEFMDAACWPWFKLWMLAQVFRDRDRCKVWVPRLHRVGVLDPLAAEARVPRASRSLVTLDIFCPSGAEGRMVPVSRRPGPQSPLPEGVSFARAGPEPDVVRLTRTLLGSSPLW